MSILDTLTAPWAITPEKLSEIRSIYESHARGEKANIKDIEARLGKSLNNSRSHYAVLDGVAIIEMQGVMGKKMNLFSEISGGASTEIVANEIKDAVADDAVDSILLHIDSPGGTVDGTENLAQVVRDARDHKRIIAFTDGQMASAAYWVGSAATEIVAASSTSTIGSIGVVTKHVDISKAEEAEGIKTTEITAGKYKRIASQHEPLTESGRESLQEHIDQLYTIFVNAVAENRGVNVDVVLEDMADGRVFLANQAMRRGMIDRIASMEQIINELSINNEVVMSKKVENQEVAEAPSEITLDNIKEQYPDIVHQLHTEGAESERERIKECESATFPGHEALVNSMKFDGKSKKPDVAVAVMEAERRIREDKGSAFTGNAPDPLPLAPVVGISEKDAADDISKTPEERAKAKWDKDAELQAEFGGDFDSFMALERAQTKGSLKVIGGK